MVWIAQESLRTPSQRLVQMHRATLSVHHRLLQNRHLAWVLQTLQDRPLQSLPMVIPRWLCLLFQKLHSKEAAYIKLYRPRSNFLRTELSRRYPARLSQKNNRIEVIPQQHHLLHQLLKVGVTPKWTCHHVQMPRMIRVTLKWTGPLFQKSHTMQAIPKWLRIPFQKFPKVILKWSCLQLQVLFVRTVTSSWQILPVQKHFKIIVTPKWTCPYRLIRSYTG